MAEPSPGYLHVPGTTFIGDTPQKNLPPSSAFRRCTTPLSRQHLASLSTSNTWELSSSFLCRSKSECLTHSRMEVGIGSPDSARWRLESQTLHVPRLPQSLHASSHLQLLVRDISSSCDLAESSCDSQSSGDGAEDRAVDCYVGQQRVPEIEGSGALLDTVGFPSTPALEADAVRRHADRVGLLSYPAYGYRHSSPVRNTSAKNSSGVIEQPEGVRENSRERSRFDTCDGRPRAPHDGDLLQYVGVSAEEQHSACGDAPVSRADVHAGIDVGSWSCDVQVSLECTNGAMEGCDVIGTVDFDGSGMFFATGGIARKIRVYSLSRLDLLKEEGSKDRYSQQGLARKRVRRGCLEEREAVQEDSDDDEDEEERQLRRKSRSPSSDLIRRERPDPDGRQSRGGRGTPVLDRDAATSAVICTPAKLSCLRWVSSNVVGCGDYDGVVSEWDLERGLCVSERDEHGGQRVWAVDYASGARCSGLSTSSTLCASASDDGTVRLWPAGSDKSCGLIRPPSGRPVCAVDFCPNGSDHLLALGCADSNAYVYDIRNSAAPLHSFQGHSRAVSYVKYAGPGSLLSASVDSTVRLWAAPDQSSCPSSLSRSAATSSAVTQCLSPHARQLEGSRLGPAATLNLPIKRNPHSRLQTVASAEASGAIPKALWNDHQNRRNFVGLSVLQGSSSSSNRGGRGAGTMFATGSETNQLMIYHTHQSKAVATVDFTRQTPSPVSSSRCQPFVSAVSWQQAGEERSCVGAAGVGTLVAANSEGVVRIIQVNRG